MVYGLGSLYASDPVFFDDAFALIFNTSPFETPETLIRKFVFVELDEEPELVEIVLFKRPSTMA